jgi:hypothetical protein
MNPIPVARLIIVAVMSVVSAGGCASHGQETSRQPALDYEVDLSADGRELAVVARFEDVGPPLEVSGAGDFLFDVEGTNGRDVRALERGDGVWIWPKPVRGVLTVRYRFRLEAAARAFETLSDMGDQGRALVLAPGAWLLRPRRIPAEARARLRVRTPARLGFVTGATPAANGDGSYEVSARDLEGLPYTAFGTLRRRTLELAGCRFEIAFMPGALRLGDDAIVEWIGGRAKMIAGLYGAFPVARTAVIVRPSAGGGVGSASASGVGGTAILLPLGTGVSPRELDRDWVLVHEMIHLAMPQLPSTHHWFEEGLATYLEPIARCRAGALDADGVWNEWLRDMPQGQPSAGRGGLDSDASWGRTYWGGAAFCLVADVEIRRRTSGAKSLLDALRGIRAERGTLARQATFEDVIASGDRSTGVPVLRELYERHARRADPFELDPLWKNLGVDRAGGSVRYDDRAPLAAVRRALLER